jgi:ABC-type Na+ efflux pump permease subunit
MKRETLLLFLGKELSDLRSNRQVWPAYLLLPLVAILLPLLLLALLPVLVQQGQTGQDAAVTMLLETVARDSSLRGSTLEERLARLLMRDLTMFYLLMPIVLSASAAALALVREKEQRTLEPILATPIRDRDLLLAKLIAAVIPALLITWAAFIVGSLVTMIGSWWTVHAIILPTSGNLVGVLLLAPALSAVAALLALRVSARFTDVPGAMQFTGLVVVPVTLILLVLLGRPAMMWPLVGLGGAILVFGLGFGLFRMNLRKFAREEILTNWK